MIYIITILICLYCSIYFDVWNKNHNRKTAYNGLLIWFIAISALQYKMGTDMIYYMDWYDKLNTDDWSIKDLISDNVRYQPGWMALSYLCRLVSKDFILLKLVQAIFVNIAIFSFFKRETKYVFVAIFIYGIMSYLVINFNLMRQSIAIGFVLFALTCLRLKDYKRYYIFVLLAYLFHDSAFILILLPLINLFNNSKKRNKKKSTTIVVLAFVVILCALSFVNLENILSNLMSFGYLGENITGTGMAYMAGERLGIQSKFAVFSIQRMIMIVAIVYYMKKYNNPYYGALGLIYVLFQILTGFLPILWRFRLYFDFPYYIILARLFVEFVKSKKRFSSVAMCAILMLMIFFPMRDYLSHVDNSKYRNIDQYYPYHSVFEKEFDEKKQRFFDNLAI